MAGCASPVGPGGSPLHTGARTSDGARLLLVAIVALTLGLISHCLMASLSWGIYLAVPRDATLLSAAALLLALLNVGIGALNLLPIVPLDGGRAVLAFAAARASRTSLAHA